MKRRLFIVLLLIISAVTVISLVSCGNNAKNTTATTPADNGTTTTPATTVPVTTTKTPVTTVNPFAEKDPWDVSLEIPTASLMTVVEKGTKLFSGLEWTGKTNSKDASGKTVNQSDIVSINEIDYHSSTTVVYGSLLEAYKAATTYSPELSSYYKLITGEGNEWQLAVYKNEATAKAAGVLNSFYKTDYDMSTAPKYEGNNKVSQYRNSYYGGFKTVTLPASWQTQGFDFPIYSNTTYPWSNDAYGNGSYTLPIAPSVTNPVGFYRYYLDINEDWIADGRRVYLSFDGVESAYYLYVNGYEVGYSEDSFDSSTFDITEFLNSDGKENLIAVKVYRWCDGSYFENQDYLRLAGIFRDAYVYSVTGVNIADYTVVTDLDAKFVNSDLDITAEIVNSTTSDVAKDFYSLDVRLIDAEGNSVFADSPFRSTVGEIASGDTATVKMSKKVTAPHLWSDEDPYLYTLIISLYDKNGVYYGSISQQLGFREITFTSTRGTSANSTKYQTILLNGKPLIFKGVNRHDNDPETGRYISKELCEKDILIMKSLNINSVRTSHYPNTRYFYDMCDKYGILVLAECNIETHYGVSTSETEKYFREVVKDRVYSHANAAKNRTSVVMWSIGNETNSGTSIYYNVISGLKKLDPTRPVHYESLGNSGGVDVASTMYSSVYEVLSRGLASNHMPYLICEYAHAMGNSVGNLYEYWESIRSYDNLMGGFIWDFVDQSLWTNFTMVNGFDYYGNKKYLAYGGAWGDSPNSGNFCQNGIISATREIQPEAYEVKYVYQSIWFTAGALTKDAKKVSVYNEYHFTNLSAFDYEYELICNGKVIDSGTFKIDCAPGETVVIEIPYKMPEKTTADGEYFLNLRAKLSEDTNWAEKGHIIATEQLDIYAEVEHISLDTSKMGNISSAENGDEIKISGADFELIFDKSKGVIDSYTYKGEKIITSGPTPNYTRARVDNDKNVYGWDNAKVTDVTNFKLTKDPSGKFITLEAKLTLSYASCYQYMTYKIYGDGEVTVTATLEMSDTAGEMYRYGTNLTLPGDYENITFYGNGEFDSYSDRLRAAHVGLYSTTVSDSYYPYPKPQDTGLKTGVRYFALTSDSKNTGILVVSDSEMEASALHVSIAQLKAAKYTYTLKYSKTNTYLSLNYGSRGTGGASCGPDTLSQYRLLNDGRDYTFSYTIVPYDAKTEDIGEISLIWRDAKSTSETEIDKILADNVISQINSLTLDDSKVKEVRAAYDSLTDAQKKLVTNYTVLEKIEKGDSVKTVFTDLSDNANTGKLTAGYVTADSTSPVGYKLTGNFTSSDKGGKINSALSGTKNFSLGAYIKLDDFDSNNIILAKGDNQVAIKTNSSGQIEFFIYQNGAWNAALIENPSAAGIKLGEWFYIVGVREGNTLKLYVNGKLAATKSVSGSVNTSSAVFGVGTDPTSGRTLRGSVAIAHVFSKALTEAEIMAQYKHYTEGSAAAYTAKDSVVWYDVSMVEYQ